MSAHNDVGTFGEALTRYTLAQVAPVQAGRAADLLCLGVEIEVKTARPTDGPRLRWGRTVFHLYV